MRAMIRTAALALVALTRRLPRFADVRRPALRLATTAIGGLAAFWFFERLAGF